MYFLRRLGIFLNSLFLFLGLSLVWKNKGTWLYVLIFLIVYLFLSVLYLNKNKFNKNFFNKLTLPVLFLVAVFSFSLFVGEGLFFYLFLLLSSIILYYYLKQLLFFSYYHFKYQAYIQEGLSLYLSLFLCFLFAVVGFGAIILLKTPLWLVLLILGLIFSLLINQLFYINKISFKKGKIFIISIVVVLLELMGALVFLPLSYYVTALILSVFFYLTVNLSRLYLSDSLNKQQIKNYLLISLLILVITLSTAQWI